MYIYIYIHNDSDSNKFEESMKLVFFFFFAALEKSVCVCVCVSCFTWNIVQVIREGHMVKGNWHAGEWVGDGEDKSEWEDWIKSLNFLDGSFYL